MRGGRPSERLIVFGRLPEGGRAKTRLVPALGEVGAARLYQGFLDDALQWAPEAGSRELWIPARPGAREELARRYPDTRVRVQAEGSLGARLRGAFADAFADRVDYVVIAGSDHPTLPPAYLARAFRALRGAHLAWGPTRDGGYYAIGLRRYCWPRAAGLFEDAPWSTSRLSEWTRARAAELDLCHVELPAWYDVDRPEDLERMARDLRPGSATAAAWAEVRPAARDAARLA